MKTRNKYMTTLSVGFIIGALVQWVAMTPEAPEPVQARAGEKVADNATYAPRAAATENAEAPKPKKPKGTKVKITDVAEVTIAPKTPECPPVTAVCSLTEEEDGNRGVLFETDDGMITDSRHWQLEPGKPRPRSFDWQVSALAVKPAGEDTSYGIRVQRNFGFMTAGVGVTPNTVMADFGVRF